MRLRVVVLLLVGVVLGVSCESSERGTHVGKSSSSLAAGEVSVPSTGDTHIANNKDKNYAYEAETEVKGSGDNRTLVSFDPAAVAAAIGTRTVVSAEIEFTLREATANWGSSGRDIDVYRITVPWMERFATDRCWHDSNPLNGSKDCASGQEWDPGNGYASTPTSSKTITNGLTGAIRFDVTNDLADLLSNQIAGNGWLLSLDGGSGKAVFWSRETEEGPRLVLTLAATDAGAEPPTPPEKVEVLVIDQGEDTYVQDGSPNQNKDGELVTQVKDSGRNSVLVKFDEAAVLSALADHPNGRFVLEMAIEENFNNWSDGRSIGAHRVDQDWSAVDATWNCAHDADTGNGNDDCSGSDAWLLWDNGAPANFAWNITASDVAILANGQGGVLTWDVTEDVKGLAGAGSHHGWFLRNEEPNAAGRVTFHAFEAGSTTVPKLRVYDVPTIPNDGGAGDSGATDAGAGDSGTADASVDAGPVCTPVAGDDTSCDGIDDDCDGSVDEDYASEATSCGVGACGSTGATTCVAGTVEDSCSPGSPAASDDTCDGIDDDCDGVADEDYGSVPTACGVGACGAMGATTCVAGVVEDSCTPGTPTSDANCDGIDDNCDGTPDDGATPLPTTCGIGGCAAEGFFVCEMGTVVNTCVPGAPVPDDNCDTVDDDCDYLVDEAFLSDPTTCGVGACGSAGATYCSLGDVVDSCSPTQPGSEMGPCNGIDDDCDGTVDETCCDPTTCAAAGAACGDLDDGCGGTLDCGTCVSPTECGVVSPNQCDMPTTWSPSFSTPLASFDVANWNTQARVIRSSPHTGSIHWPVVQGVSWTPTSSTASKFFTVDLSGDGIWVLDHLEITSVAAAPIDHFELWVSDKATFDENDLVHAGTFDVGGVGTFDFEMAPVRARFAEVRVLPAEGTTGSWTSYVREFKLMTRDGRTGGVLSMHELGADVVGGTPTRSGWPATTGIDYNITNLGWVVDQTTNVSLDIELSSANHPTNLLMVRSDRTYQGETPKDMTLWVSETGTEGTYVQVAEGITGQNNGAHYVPWDGSVPGRFFRMTSNENNGHASFYFLTEIKVYSEHLGGQTVAFDDTTETNGSTPVSWLWDFGDGQTSTERHPVHRYDAPGTYTVRLTVTDDLGAQAYYERDYTALEEPGVDISVVPPTLYEGGSVLFTDTSTAGAPPLAVRRWTIDTVSGNPTSTSVNVTNASVGHVHANLWVQDYGLIESEKEATAQVYVTGCTPTGTPDDNCDDIDDDCDGVPDDEYIGATTTCGTGSCAVEGEEVCVAGAVQDVCVPGTPAADDATCDGADDDCDGVADEDFPAGPSICGNGVCVSTGIQSCTAGVRNDTCVPSAPTTTEDGVCDGIDDDCDGVADEDYAPTGTTCGVAACGSTGTLECVAGVLTDNCSPLPPGADDSSCDHVDSDCDGDVDEDCCVPTTCTAAMANCGTVSDGCGGTIDCGTCAATETCGGGGTPNVCAANAIPVDPATEAPPLPEVGDSRLIQLVGFLFDGTGSQQQGVAPGAIRPQAVAAVHGRVLDELRLPLPGVRISIKDHPEYGFIYSRADGTFDLAFNGNEDLVLLYEAYPRLPVERRFSPDWETYKAIDDVVMIPQSNTSTVIDLESTEGQWALGDTELDDDGPRQLAVWFPPGTTAAAEVDGMSVPLDYQITVRTTEYTVGLGGAQRMPADLPAGTAYTYAAELAVDEVGPSAHVTFNQDIPSYLDNFLDLAPGSVIPSGEYDRELSTWIPENDGYVIEIVSITDGKADLNATYGDSDPEDPADLLAKMGITDTERAALAVRYPVGKTLWRVPLDSFSSVDYNGSGVLSQPPEDAKPEEAEAYPKDSCDPQISQSGWSTIHCPSRALGEMVPVAGTGFGLSYSTKAVMANTGHKNTIDMRMPAPTANLISYNVRVEMFGRTVHQATLPPTTIDYSYTWDGLDPFGRPWRGATYMRYFIDLVVQPEYFFQIRDQVGFLTATGETQSFGGQNCSTSDPCCVSGTQGYRIPAYRWGNGIFETFLSQRSVPRHLVGESKVEDHGLGGFSLDVLHQYSPLRGELRLGTGSVRTVDDARSRVEVFLGRASDGIVGNETSQLQGQVDLSAPWHLSVDQFGRLHWIMQGRLWRLNEDGTTERLATNLNNFFNGGIDSFQLISDKKALVGIHNPITSLWLIEDTGVGGVWSATNVAPGAYVGTYMPDGTLYYAKFIDNNPIQGAIFRRIPGGTDEEVYRSIPHRVAQLMKVSPAGRLAFLEYNSTGLDWSRIMELDPATGAVRTLAGYGSQTSNGTAATDVYLHFVRSYDWSPEGDLYVVTHGNYGYRLLWRFDP
ncbi:MAG: DNRLRE domain-containing protein, partial [Myxococcales bacterium]|nr:DNRLRE domain-containing protein [Myxococcales bacterium]